MVSASETREGADPTALRAILQYATSEALARAQNLDFPGQVHARVERQAAEAENAFVGLVPIVKRVATILTVGTILLSSSVFLYGFLYFMVMPSYKSSGNLYFDYSGIAKHPAPVPRWSNDENSWNGRGSMVAEHHIDNAPWAVVDLFSKQSQWEAFHEACIPKPLTDRRILKPGHAYYLEVILDLPESERNLLSGVFGVLVEIQSHNGTLLASSLRSSRIPHETSWVSTVRKILMLIPLLIGASQETRSISVPSFRHFVESPDLPLRYVTVKVFQEQHTTIEVMTGSVRIGRELSDIQYILREYFFTCYATGTAMFFIFQLLLVAVGRLYLEQRQKSRMEEEPSLNFELHGSQAGNDFAPPDDVAWDVNNEVPLNTQTRLDERQAHNGHSRDSANQIGGSHTPTLSQENT